jgi:hypothetical protein
MSSAAETQDHETIRKWVEERGGRPAQVEGTGGMLRIEFDKAEEKLNPITWDDFFKVFDERGLRFLYSPEKNNRFNKLVYD